MLINAPFVEFKVMRQQLQHALSLGRRFDHVMIDEMSGAICARFPDTDVSVDVTTDVLGRLITNLNAPVLHDVDDIPDLHRILADNVYLARNYNFILDHGYGQEKPRADQETSRSLSLRTRYPAEQINMVILGDSVQQLAERAQEAVTRLKPIVGGCSEADERTIGGAAPRAHKGTTP